MWAEIAENGQVEFFSPLNEPNFVLSQEEGFRWAQMVLPLIREKFSGDVVLKLGGGAEINDIDHDYSGYDYVAFDIYASADLEYWGQMVSRSVGVLGEIVKKYSLKGAFSESSV